MRYLLIVCCVVNFREEWEWLRRLSTNEVNAPPTPTQTAFHNSLVSACKKLLDNLGKRLKIPSRIYNVRFYSNSGPLINIWKKETIHGFTDFLPYFWKISSLSRNLNLVLRWTKVLSEQRKARKKRIPFSQRGFYHTLFWGYRREWGCGGDTSGVRHGGDRVEWRGILPPPPASCRERLQCPRPHGGDHREPKLPNTTCPSLWNE